MLAALAVAGLARAQGTEAEAGEAAPRIDASTMTGKIMVGYQGWFTAEGDGLGRGFHHYGRGGAFEPGSCSIDLWPDMSEATEEEKFATPFRRADGSVAHVFSSGNRQTMMRHFEWMRDYGIDGVFFQRFGAEVRHEGGRRHFDQVLRNGRDAANETGRVYSIMYDLSGLQAGELGVVVDDWKRIVDEMGLWRDPRDASYLRHRGRPVVAVWGIGFNDGRGYTLEECRDLVEFLKNDPDYGGMTVVLGVPTCWRTLSRDTVADPALHEIIRMADVVCPWFIGRFREPGDVERMRREVWEPDMAWCREAGLDYLPTAWPGFSWHNMRPETPPDMIPRRGGRFLWAQHHGLVDAGAQMIYQAMFDELDEGTAIMKVDPNPPVGASPFLAHDDVPPDHYLWLVGEASRMLRGERPLSPEMPTRTPE